MTTTNSSSIAEAVDRVVQDAASRVPPGVVAGVTTAEETLYLGASGYRDLGTKTPMTTDSVFAIFSTTKALTGVAALQLRESGGDLDFDAPAKEYAPALGEVQVLEGFDDNGDPVLRAPKSDITTKQLLLHTAGVRIRLLQRAVQPSGGKPWAAQHRHFESPRSADTFAVRSGRAVGVRQQHRLGRTGDRGGDYRPPAR